MNVLKDLEGLVVVGVLLGGQQMAQRVARKPQCHAALASWRQHLLIVGASLAKLCNVRTRKGLTSD